LNFSEATVMEIVIWAIAGIVLGAAGGAAFTYWWTRARGGGDTIGQLKRENQKFREEVTEHFVETARLINQLTDSYKEVFDHLNKGATELVDEKALTERLPASGSEEVRLRRLGSPAPSHDGDGDTGGGDAQPGGGAGAAAAGAAATSAGASAGSGDRERRAPHERADIEAGPLREAPRPSDRDVDPLKRGKSSESAIGEASTTAKESADPSESSDAAESADSNDSTDPKDPKDSTDSKTKPSRESSDDSGGDSSRSATDAGSERSG